FGFRFVGCRSGWTWALRWLRPLRTTGDTEERQEKNGCSRKSFRPKLHVNSLLRYTASCASAARLARPKTARQSGFLHSIRLGKNEGSTRWERSQSQKCGDTATVKNDRYNEEWSGRRGLNSQLSAWE